MTEPGLAEIGALTDWPDLDKIPATVTSTGPGGLEVRGYPALVAEGRTTGLRVLTDAARQAIEHRRGVAHLLTCRLALSTSRITSRWSGTQSLTLAASPYATTEALVADLQSAAVASLATGRDLAKVRTREAFDTLATSLRDSFEDEVQRLAELAATIQTASRELDATIKHTTSMALLNVLTDVRDQHAGLVYAGYLSTTSPGQLVHLPRYLRAAVIRLEKAEANPHRDADLAWRIGDLSDAWWSAMRSAEHEPIRAARLAPIRWQLEELRVSFFAQQLGTPVSVSEKRIRKALTDA